MTTNKNKNNVDYDVKILEVKNLKKHFHVGTGKNKLIVPAVDDVTFDVYKREIFGLVGESGSGKTTTGRTIIKLYNPTEGTVHLNGLQISAGYMEHVREIKNIKSKLVKDLIALEPAKLELEKIKEEKNIKIKEFQFEIQQINNEYDEKRVLLEQDILEYKRNKYSLTEQYKLGLDSLEYKFTLNKNKIIESTRNVHLKEFNEEVEIQKTKFKNKYEGLKESAALQKEEIKRRIVELREETDTEIKALEEKFKDLIIKGAAEAIDKQTAKTQIKELTAKYKADRSALKEKYQKDLSKLVEPNYDKFKEGLTVLNEEFKTKKLAIKQKIAKLNQDTNEQIKAVKEKFKTNALSSDERSKLAVTRKELKDKAHREILIQKERIAVSKQINASKEALNASRLMQMIFQDPISSLNPRMTVREIIGEGLIILGKHSKEEINQKVEEILKIVGLAPEFATRYPHEFSGGQRQRIGIARALIMEPNFIIADEPISALDVSIQAQVINLISDLKDILDLTVLFIAHDLSVVRFFCDRVAVMHVGKIVEIAETEELFKNPMHPYTISLLSAIPQPDPDYEKGRKRIHYNPKQHNYFFDKPSLREISPGHSVYANDEEFKLMKELYNKKNKEVK